MRLQYSNARLAADCILWVNEPSFDRNFFQRDRQFKYLTIAWNKGEEQQVTVDEIKYVFPSNSMLPLVVNQSFRFERPEDVVAWQFNREFYCIVDHDQEVSCVGFIFYGSGQIMFIQLNGEESRKFEMLLEVFKEEFENHDRIQQEMLRILLVRLIIKVTRLAKEQYLDKEAAMGKKFDLIRQFNLMVENHFKAQHQVAFYAEQLNRSPKTLSNLFSTQLHPSPQEIIQQRIILEARRLYYYTDKSTKEIAAELGFEDAGHFSRFFKNRIGLSPTEYKKSILET